MEKKIWHEPVERPEDGDCIVSPDGLVGEYEYDNGRECIFCPNGHIEFMRHWESYAHIDDLIATSKALEVAIGKLKELADCPYQGGEQSVKLGVTVTAQAALQEIESLMKCGEKKCEK